MTTKKQYKQVIEISNGTKVDVSDRLGISRSAVTQYLNKNPELNELLEQIRKDNIDLAESETFKQLKFYDDKNKVQAATIRQKASQFVLTRLGKGSGWVEKTESAVEHTGESLKIIIEEKKPDGDKASTES